MYLYAWTTSPDHVHVWLLEHANLLYHMYSSGCFLTTLHPPVQILESGQWRPCCSRSECIAEAWISGCLSAPSFFQPPLDRLARFSFCYSWILSRIHIVHPAFALLGDFIFLRYCILPCDNCVLVLLFLECILPLCFRTLILACPDA